MKRYLVTTAHESTWKIGEPTLFLGEWCRRYDRKHIWTSMDFEIASPYGVDPEAKKKDFRYLGILAEVLLSEITETLNKYHKVAHSTRYWNIVLGHWLQRFLRIYYNRYKTIEQVFGKYSISGTMSLQYEKYDLASWDSISFILNCNKDHWNHILNIEILKFFGFPAIEQKDESIETKKEFIAELQKPLWKKSVIFLINNIFPLFGRDTDAFLINSYLPSYYEVILQIRLGQFPQIWKLQNLQSMNVNENVRQSLYFEDVERDGFESFIRKMIPRSLPVCYLEGYSRILGETKNVKWPKKPKFIFTSNNFDTDELFKVWTAEQVVNHGTPYFVGQHGNNYSTLIGIEKVPELVSTDRFITWGWSKDHRKQIPAFVLTKCNIKVGNYDPTGGLLLVEFPPALRLGPEDNWFDFTKYFEEQVHFYNALPSDIRKNLIIRLHNASKSFDWFDEDRWKEVDPNVKIDLNQSTMNELIANSRLIVHSYDSTGVLETMSLNIPTLCFWRNEFGHLTEDTIPFYNKLKDVGIFQPSPEKAVEFITKIWGSVDSWWKSEEVQIVRSEFCNQYARTTSKPIGTLKQILLSASKK